MRLFKWTWCQLVGHQPLLAQPKNNGGVDWILSRTNWATGDYVGVYICQRCGAFYPKFGKRDLGEPKIEARDNVGIGS